MKCCIYTRIFFETPYINFFIEHYIQLGFDKIIILQTDNIEYSIPNEWIDFVEIYKVENKGDISLKENDYILKNSDYDWILSVDLDEILILNKKYKDIKDYIKIHTDIYNNITIFYFRWGMIEKIDNNGIVSFSEILTKYNIYSNSHIKSMCRKSSLLNVYISHLFTVNENNIFFEGKIVYENKPIWDLNDNSYEDTILVHLHTRSIHNIFTKSFITRFDEKKISNKQGFLDFIGFMDIKNDSNIIEKFKEYIGLKAELPFRHSTSPKINVNLFDLYNIYHYKYDLIDTEKEKRIIQYLLTNDNIDITKYDIFTTLLSDEINKKHYSTFYK